ncbi:hypothetical protein [Streptomyces sp. NPDC088725]|uniref:hypothetical protein n=1 Tax=Streptomyces sp. NPDC088725 TaxID=3365873 RepID=UPI003823EB1E
MTDPALALLRQQPHLAELAARSFHFDLRRTEHHEPVRLASGAPLEAVAGDDTGGTYFVCGGGAVLYASSEGKAGLIGDSVTEALEVIVGLPGWSGRDCFRPLGDEDGLASAASPEAANAHAYLSETAAPRAELLAGLGLPARSPAELVARLRTALLRTDLGHLLLNAREGLAYSHLNGPTRPPRWETVLAPGLADLRLMRSDPASWPEVAPDAGRRAAALRAAQFARGDESDLPLLRVLLRHEAAGTGMSEELRLAAVLVGRFGLTEDLPLLHEARATDPETQDGLFELPRDARRVARWARALDDARFGTDPGAASPLLWARLASRQGRTELARAILIRTLDEAGPDAPLLDSVRGGLEELGDFAQAARAQRALAPLRDAPWERGTACLTLARLERAAADHPAARAALRRTLAELAKDERPVDWRRFALGRTVTEEHLLLAGAAAGAGRTELAHEVMAVAVALLGELPARSRETLTELADETARLIVSPAPDRSPEN